jgi:hypothetical protein
MNVLAIRRRPSFDNRPVLASVPLKPGFTRDDLPRVDDPNWNLEAAVFRENARSCHTAVHFDVVPEPDVREALRAYLYIRLNVDLPSVRRRLTPTTVRAAFNIARRFFAFVHHQLGVVDMMRVDQALLDDYIRALEAERRRSAHRMAHLLEPIQALHDYRHHLGRLALTFTPWSGRSPYRVAGCRQSRENRTPRMPEAVIQPLLAWSLRYVSTFATDIFAAREAFDRLHEHRDRMRAADSALGERNRRHLHRERLEAHFERLAREGRGVPIWAHAHNGATRTDPQTGHETPPVNAHLLHLIIGVDAVAEPASHIQLSTGAPDLIEAASRRLGVETGGLDSPIGTLSGTDRPWRPRFDIKTLVIEERMLQAAAYVVCAYLTGMRDCEVQAMRRGCLTLTRSEDGLIERHRIRSTAYKAKPSRGEQSDWVTIAPVADAVAVMDRLGARFADARGLDTLWQVLSLLPVSKAHVSAEIVRQLNKYRDHLNASFGTSGEPIIPPCPDGRLWRITTRQFRRTIAWHIANRPFGTIAGMIQYKHASVAAFEGYAGSTPSGFRAEIEAQRALGQIDDILSYFDERQGGATLTGPAAPRIARTLDTAARALAPLPAMLADRPRLRTLLASLAQTLHVGVLADCFFDPGTALCLKHADDPGAAAPLTALCMPTRCPNACITARHRSVWERSAADARTLLKEKRLPPLQRQALRQDLARIETVLRGLDPAPSVPEPE